MTGAQTPVREREGRDRCACIEDLDAVSGDLSAFVSAMLDAKLRRAALGTAGARCGRD